MKYIIDIDTGSTYTDCLVAGDGIEEWVKAETTPHDLTVCVMSSVEEAAKKLGLSLEDLLRKTEVFRYSTTLVTNTVLRRTGTKLGVIVTRGAEHQELLDILAPFVERELIVGVDEQVDEAGNVVKPVVEDEVRAHVKYLLDHGARALVVALSNSFANPANENTIKGLVVEEYPKHYLGYPPVTLSSSVSVRRGNYPRIGSAVVDAYTHGEVARCLYRTEESLRKRGLAKPLIVVHSNKGGARVAKTVALSTWGSGPVAAVNGCELLSKHYGIENIVALDIGGTSSDIGLIVGGKAEWGFQPEAEKIPIDFPMVEISSIGVAGGSIISIDKGKIRVGPDSAGALPGPVSYGLGGMEATVSDAALVLGYYDPDYFFGGRRKLDRELAARTIENRIAEPMKIKVEEAAYEIYRVSVERVVETIRARLSAAGVKPEDCCLFSYGGTGGTFCCKVAEGMGIKKVLTSGYSAVFSAWGASLMDVVHFYELRGHIQLRDEGGSHLSQYEPFNEVVKHLKDRAARDMEGEGQEVAKVEYGLELEVTDGEGALRCVIPWPSLFLGNEQDISTICEAFSNEFSKVKEGQPDGGIWVEVLKLRATILLPHPEMKTREYVGESADKASKGRRECYWENGFQDTVVYERGLLKAGNIIKGPAIVEAADSNIVLPDRWELSVDKYLNGMIQKV